MTWTVNETTTNQMADDWNDLNSGFNAFYAKQPPANMGWDEVNYPLPTAISIGGKAFCDRKPEDYIDPSTFPNILYVDKDAGGAGDGSSWANAFTSITAALNAVEASGIATRILVMGGKNYTLSTGATSSGNITYMTTGYSIEGVHGRVLCTASSLRTWTLSAGTTNVYEAGLTSAIRAYDIESDTILESVGSIAECDDTQGSMYTDGSITYVHHKTSAVVDDDNTQVFRNVPCFAVGGTAKAYIRNIDARGGAGSAFRSNCNPSLVAPTEQEGWIIFDNCTAKYSMGGSFASVSNTNGFWQFDMRFVGYFNCSTDYTTSDGFNMTAGTLSVAPHVLAVNNQSYRGGVSASGFGVYLVGSL